MDILVNAAGGNVPGATLDDQSTPFDLELSAYRDVVELNYFGTLTTINAFGPALAASRADDRAIVNIWPARATVQAELVNPKLLVEIPGVRRSLKLTMHSRSYASSRISRAPAGYGLPNSPSSVKTVLFSTRAAWEREPERDGEAMDLPDWSLRRSPKPKVAGSSPVAPVRSTRRKACI